MVDEAGWHGLDRDDVIDEASGSGAARHALQCSGVVLGLSQGQTAELLDGPDADGAVAADTCKHDANRTLPAVFGQRRKEGIDGPAIFACRRRCHQVEYAVLDGQLRVGRDDENAVGFDGDAVLGGDYRNGALRPKQLDQQALVMRVEVLHQHEGHAGVGGCVSQKCLEGGKPAGRGADTNDEGGGLARHITTSPTQAVMNGIRCRMPIASRMLTAGSSAT
jgi:hypothetical protein